MKPRLLIANDDGIDSPFLPPFAKAIAAYADISIVVPAREQSWIGRAYSRHSELRVEEREFHGFECRTVSGTPADCVNIALSHLCKSPPDAVISGLNIGQNIAFPLLWSSGTFAAAVEAAGWGFPAFAFSMRLEKKYYEACRIKHSPPPPALLASLETAGAHAAEFVARALEGGMLGCGDVANVNYPIGFGDGAAFERCVPARAKLASLYVKNSEGNFNFAYNIGETSSPDGTLTDLECLDKGAACYSIINIGC